MVLPSATKGREKRPLEKISALLLKLKSSMARMLSFCRFKGQGFYYSVILFFFPFEGTDATSLFCR